MTDETRNVRDSEALDWTALFAWLRDALPAGEAVSPEPGCRPIAGVDAPATRAGGAAAAPAVAQFGGGHSNLTYLITVNGQELVLRRPPLGPVPPRAHDMAREFRWLCALHPLFPLAPRPLLLCEDLSVIGSVFYVMERRRGLVIRHSEPPEIAGQPDRRRAISETLIDTLASLHQVDATHPALASLGRPGGFVERQVHGWSERWKAAQTEELAQMDAVAAWLAAHLPPEPDRPSVVHGDFKLDNVMLAAEPPHRVVAVLDWEMCALGDPLVDLGIFLGYWLPTPGGDRQAPADALSTVSDRPGYLGREALLDRYAARTTADLSHLAFYETFAVFKLAVVLQQIYVRYVRGQTDDDRFATLNTRVARLARRAAELAERQD